MEWLYFYVIYMYLKINSIMFDIKLVNCAIETKINEFPGKTSKSLNFQ